MPRKTTKTSEAEIAAIVADIEAVEDYTNDTDVEVAFSREELEAALGQVVQPYKSDDRIRIALTLDEWQWAANQLANPYDRRLISTLQRNRITHAIANEYNTFDTNAYGKCLAVRVPRDLGEFIVDLLASAHLRMQVDAAAVA